MAAEPRPSARGDVPSGETTLLRTRPGLLFVLTYRQGWWLLPPAALWLIDYSAARLSTPIPRLMQAAVAWLVVGLLWRIVAWLSRSYLLTDRRLLVRAGVVSRVLGDVPLARIQHTTMTQTAAERLFNLGTIGIATAGSGGGGGAAIHWLMVPQPHETLAAIRRATGQAAVLRPASPVPSAPAAPVIGLAGGIGSGKSEVARILGDLGCIVIDADKEAKEALDRPEVRDWIVEWWGRSVLQPDGRVNRRAVADIIFADDTQRRRLEGLVHPLLGLDSASLHRRAGTAGDRPIVIDAPLLFEAGLDRECDALVFVDAPREVRLARVRTARAWDEAEFARRENAQIPLEEKRRRCRSVVSNAGTPDELRAEVRRMYTQILARAGG